MINQYSIDAINADIPILLQQLAVAVKVHNKIHYLSKGLLRFIVVVIVVVRDGKLSERGELLSFRDNNGQQLFPFQGRTRGVLKWPKLNQLRCRQSASKFQD